MCLRKGVQCWNLRKASHMLPGLEVPSDSSKVLSDWVIGDAAHPGLPPPLLRRPGPHIADIRAARVEPISTRVQDPLRQKLRRRVFCLRWTRARPTCHWMQVAQESQVCAAAGSAMRSEGAQGGESRESHAVVAPSNRRIASLHQHDTKPSCASRAA